MAAQEAGLVEVRTLSSNRNHRALALVWRLRAGNIGGAEGNRTPDLCSAIAALSHLSYGPG